MPSPDGADPGRIVLAVHGGAGTIPRSEAGSGGEAGYRAGLERALRAGHAVLAGGGTARDAVVSAVRVLEDDPHFNAGRGSVFTSEGRVEMDAAIMDGRARAAGAVAGVTNLRNPIAAARAVMEAGAHVLLIGPGAEAFALSCGLETAPPDYFFTQGRWDQLQAARGAGRVSLDHDGTSAPDPDKYGTVGAVALDAFGDLAAATSTGGLTNKRPGRVGDSPIVGAGTYADNATAAVSCTGTGEAFLRGVVAYDVAARMRYAGTGLAEAVEATIRDALDARGGRGGLIALDRAGRVALRFNTEGMYRGVIRADGRPEVSVHADA